MYGLTDTTIGSVLCSYIKNVDFPIFLIANNNITILFNHGTSVTEGILP